MSVRVFVPRDAGALAVGADEVAAHLMQAAKQRGIRVDIVRTGSRGLYWLEPMIEVATPQGRVAYGPVAPNDLEGLLDAFIAPGGAHPLWLGLTEDIPWLKRQTRLTFVRCGIVDPLSLFDYRAHGGYAGLARALSLTPDAIVKEVVQSGLRAGAAAPVSRPASSGGRSRRRKHGRSISCATPTKAIPEPLQIACCSKATRSR
jgi:formate dehydrogenase iron-sulfur subunit